MTFLRVDQEKENNLISCFTNRHLERTNKQANSLHALGDH